MGKRLTIKGADFSANCIGSTEPDTPVIPDEPVVLETQEILPSLQSGGAAYTVTSAIGPSIPIERDGYIKTILSSVDQAGNQIHIAVVDPESAIVSAFYRNVPLTGTETDVRGLDLFVPAGHYIGYAKATQQAPFYFVNTEGSVHFESNSNVGEGTPVRLSAFNRLAITLGCVIELVAE